jgi:hypothetical protein
LERFGHDRNEVHDELVDDFMEMWKRKNLLAIETTSSDIKIDAPPNPIKELNEVIQNMQVPQEEQCETMNEQFIALEDQFETMEVDFTETYVEYPKPLELELDNEKDEEVHWEISDESIDESVSCSEERKEFEFENVEYLDDSSPHPPPMEPIFLKDIFENFEENKVMVPVTCSTSQPKDDFM